MRGDRAVDVADRHPVHRADGTVYAAGLLGDHALHLLVFRHFRARFRGDLQIGDLALMGGVGSDETFECVDALGNALRIIQPVDADDQVAAFDALPRLADHDVGRGLGREFGKGRRLDADRVSIRP